MNLTPAVHRDVTVVLTMTRPVRHRIDFGRRVSILPAAWSFMLAPRSRAFTSYTARGLDREELAEVLGLPDPEVTQPGLIADGHPDAQSFNPANRRPVEEVVRWNRRE